MHKRALKKFCAMCADFAIEGKADSLSAALISFEILVDGSFGPRGWAAIRPQISDEIRRRGAISICLQIPPWS